MWLWITRVQVVPVIIHPNIQSSIYQWVSEWLSLSAFFQTEDIGVHIGKNTRKATWKSKILKNKPKYRYSNLLVIFSVITKELLREAKGWLTDVGHNSWWHINQDNDKFREKIRLRTHNSHPITWIKVREIFHRVLTVNMMIYFPNKKIILTWYSVKQ